MTDATVKQKQINIIANSINTDSSGEARSAKKDLAVLLFPKDAHLIERAIYEHPINVRWDEYTKATSAEERAAFLLPE